MTNESTIRCGIEQVDGSCAATLENGALGWKQHVGPNGDTFWACPECAAWLATLNTAKVPPVLWVDAEGFVWKPGMNGALSMARTNQDNSPVPLPLTKYVPVEDFVGEDSWGSTTVEDSVSVDQLLEDVYLGAVQHAYESGADAAGQEAAGVRAVFRVGVAAGEIGAHQKDAATPRHAAEAQFGEGATVAAAPKANERAAR